MKRFLLPCCIMLLIALIVSLQSANGQEAESKRWLEGQKSYETPVVFYGKVEDQYGDPVPNAFVDCSVSFVSILGSIEDFNTSTDAQGRFYINKGKGANLYINTVISDGYEFVRDSTVTRMFNFRANRGNLHIADPEAPVVFKMRKMGAVPTYLDSSRSCQMQFEPKRSFTSEIDILRLWAPGCDAPKESPLYLADLKGVADWIPGATTATVAFSAEGAEDAGVLGSEEFMGVAPKSGYTTKFVLFLEDKRIPATKYLYVRSRNPLMYSCFEIRNVRMGDEFMRLSMARRTNLLGGRDLEMADDVPAAVSDHLRRTVRNSYRNKQALDKGEIENLKSLVQLSRKTTKDEGKRIYKQVFENKGWAEREKVTTAQLQEQFERAKKKE